jgi:hypothetical protein
MSFLTSVFSNPSANVLICFLIIVLMFTLNSSFNIKQDNERIAGLFKTLKEDFRLALECIEQKKIRITLLREQLLSEQKANKTHERINDK